MSGLAVWSDAARALVRVSGVSVCAWSSYRDEAAGNSVGDSCSFGDLEPLRRKVIVSGEFADDPAGVFVTVDLCSGSDYGDTGYLGKANYTAFLEEHGARRGVVEMSGAHGSFGVAIHLDADASDLAAILETLESLADYPLLDEEEHSRLEMEGTDEAWDSWARSEYGDAVLQRYGVDVSEVSSGDLRSAFETARDACNENWEEDGGSMSMHVDVDDVARKLAEPDALLDLAGAAWDPELVGGDGEPDDDAIDRVRARAERIDAEKGALHCVKRAGHKLPMGPRSAAFVETHPARSVFRCAACGRSAVVNVRPAEGAATQTVLSGDALSVRCSGVLVDGTCGHCEGALDAAPLEGCARGWLHSVATGGGA